MKKMIQLLTLGFVVGLSSNFTLAHDAAHEASSPMMEHHHSENFNGPADYMFKLGTTEENGQMLFTIWATQTKNPTLFAKVGDVVEIQLSSDSDVEHNFVIDELGVHSAHVSKSTGMVKVKFKVTKAGTFKYYCMLPGHQAAGMEGKFVVREK